MTTLQHKTVTQKTGKRDEKEWPDTTKNTNKMGTNNTTWVPK